MRSSRVFFMFFLAPPSVGGLDLDSRSSGCARLGSLCSCCSQLAYMRPGRSAWSIRPFRWRTARRTSGGGRRRGRPRRWF